MSSISLSSPKAISPSPTEISSPKIFKAEYPQELQPNGKAVQIAYDIFSAIVFPVGICRLMKHGLHKFAGKLIVPAQNNKDEDAYITSGREALISQFKGKEVTLETPDGIHLDGIYIPGQKHTASNNRTIIYFNGNGEHFEHQGLDIQHPFLKLMLPRNLSQMTKKGYNVLLFNYRGVGRSQSYSTRPGLILDGETAYQYVHKQLNVPEKNIVLFGHSLGAAVATKVASLHPETKPCNERSFSSLSKEVEELLGSSIIGKIAAKLISCIDWELDSFRLWKNMKNKKWCVYHPKDQMIIKRAQMHHALVEHGGDGVPATRLETDLSKCYKELMENDLNRPLTQGEIDSANTLARLVSDPYIDNPHNRSLLPSELNEILNHLE